VQSCSKSQIATKDGYLPFRRRVTITSIVTITTTTTIFKQQVIILFSYSSRTNIGISVDPPSSYLFQYFPFIPRKSKIFISSL
jgi:hypothetical protein